MVETTPQDLDDFQATHGTGPLDMASQLATALGAIAGDVAPRSACGIRSGDMRGADTAFVLALSSAAAARI